jgi:hypothetical protein
MEPRRAWEHIRLLTKGESAHHQQRTAMAMRLPDESRTTNASENMSVLALHFQLVFNNHCSTDSTLFEHITQQRMLWELNDHMSWEQFSKAVRKLKNAKAAGLTGVPPKAFKAMTACNLQHVYKHVNNFFLGTEDYQTSNGTAVSACLSPKVAISQTQINGEE